MKQFAALFISVALALSCTRETLYCPESPEGSQVKVCLRAEPFISKSDFDSGVKDYESKINNLTFLLFDSRGLLESIVSRIRGDKVAELSVTRGRKTVYAFANVEPDLFSDVGTLGDMDNLHIGLEQHSTNPDKGFPLEGLSEIFVSEDSAEFPVVIRRLSSRVVIRNVVNSLNGSLKGETVRLKYAYLSNLLFSVKASGGIPDAAEWRNRFGRDNSGMEISSKESSFGGELTFCELDESLPYGETSGVNRALYFLPNPSGSSDFGPRGEFTPRQTRLVIAAEIKGVTYYYLVNLGSLGRNESRIVDLKITHLGSLDPDVLNWAEELILSKNIASVINGVEDDIIIWNEGLSGTDLSYRVDDVSGPLEWSMRDTVWYGHKCTCLTLSTERPIDGFNTLGKEPDYENASLTVSAVSSLGFKVSCPVEITARVYHEVFPLKFTARQDPESLFWTLWIEGNNPLGLGFRIKGDTYYGHSAEAKYHLDKTLASIDREPERELLGNSPVEIGRISQGTAFGGIAFKFEVIPLSGPINRRPLKSPRFKVSKMYMGENTAAFFGPFPDMSPQNYPNPGEDFPFSFSVKGKPEESNPGNLFYELTAGSEQAFYIGEGTTGWNRSGSFEMEKFSGCPFYFVNGGLLIYDYEVHADVGEFFSQDGRDGVKLHALSPGRDLGLDNSDKADFGAYVGIQRRLIENSHTWIAWRSFDYGVYMMINGCSSWPGADDRFPEPEE